MINGGRYWQEAGRQAESSHSLVDFSQGQHWGQSREPGIQTRCLMWVVVMQLLQPSLAVFQDLQLAGSWCHKLLSGTPMWEKKEF